jgi:hypothetical protein
MDTKETQINTIDLTQQDIDSLNDFSVNASSLDASWDYQNLQQTLNNITMSSGTGALGQNVIGGGTWSPNVTLGTSTGTGTFTIAPQGPYVWNTTGGNLGTNISQGGRISLLGDDADLDINGKSLKQWMERVEERLNILTPNPTLEKEWDDLRELGERYRELEKKCKEKAEMWKKLKSMPAPRPE